MTWMLLPCRSLLPFVLGQRSPAIYHMSGGRVYATGLKLNWMVFFFFSLSSFLVVSIPPSIQLRTNGRNVLIVRATMTTYGFIILWYHKYEIYGLAQALNVYWCVTVVYVFFFCWFLLWFSSVASQLSLWLVVSRKCSARATQFMWTTHPNYCFRFAAIMFVRLRRHLQ